ncbi:hypothetical protein ISG33_06640 [Glaciecola sp. MH2013]|uniref:hypothetical protein n=1 Tax=Glaciecola sp. MH2013 TaxID=2785524 RepID=UPI0018A111F2|nr:hypothetical protein [Glaciecola sp. MH2013]MBF7073074.1 hypothetical protein [Glaciecola sp. MH2013]
MNSIKIQDGNTLPRGASSLHVHDTSAQAMTEVALALSMAFFSLLMLALISIGLPPSLASSSSSSELPKTMMDEQNIESHIQKVRDAEDAPANDSEALKANEETSKRYFVFIFNKQFYNQSLLPFEFEELNMAKTKRGSDSESVELVLVLAPHTSISELTEIQQHFSQYKFELALMNDEWFEVLNAKFG